jgi:hypothetical protein
MTQMNAAADDADDADLIDELTIARFIGSARQRLGRPVGSSHASSLGREKGLS